MKSVTWEPGPLLLTSSRIADKFLAANIVHLIKNPRSSSHKCADVGKSSNSCHLLPHLLWSHFLSDLFKLSIYLSSASPKQLGLPEDLPPVSQNKSPSQSSGSASSDTIGHGPEVTVSVSGRRAMRDYLILLACNPGTDLSLLWNLSYSQEREWSLQIFLFKT